jgi:branched-chain amino acid transport system substrate-binding protein
LIQIPLFTHNPALTRYLFSYSLVVLGTTLRETVGAMAEAKKLQWNVPAICSTAASSAIVAKLGGAATEGMYGVQQVPTPDPDTANAKLKAWMAAYKQKAQAPT